METEYAHKCTSTNTS